MLTRYVMATDHLINNLLLGRDMPVKSGFWSAGIGMIVVIVVPFRSSAGFPPIFLGGAPRGSSETESCKHILMGEKVP